jgi:hypothetical protein
MSFSTSNKVNSRLSFIVLLSFRFNSFKSIIGVSNAGVEREVEHIEKIIPNTYGSLKWASTRKGNSENIRRKI